MGNAFKTKRVSDIEEMKDDRKSIPVKNLSIYTGSSLIPLSLSSFCEYYGDENSSLISTSSCTKPSVFHSEESEPKSSVNKLEPIESEILTAGQFESIYEQYNAVNPDISEVLLMPIEILKTVRHLFDMWQTDLIYKFESYINYMNSDKSLLKKYLDHISNTSETNASEMFLRHSIGMIITYKMILDHLDMNKAEELIQQIAISHGLVGVAGSDFKVMDLHLTRYLLQRNLINDESIIAFVAFLSKISDEILRVLRERRNHVRSSFVTKMGLVGRANITRDNYRCMKKWNLKVPLINSRIDYIQKQIRAHEPLRKTEDVITIDTETLKAKDYIMKKLRKKTKE
ncbi:hypothetical protein HHI36_014716 [Cryptolaemus montrouzieri]|uniref:Uncharacterized protein n=1 Tax=Cryptolaemus montrouzieri TaxID=559131 RepID=A0ABD2N402_9CUCU